MDSSIASSWSASPEYIVPLKGSEKLPVDGEKNILITSALPYVNNVPHLGTIIGCVLSADVFKRFCDQKGLRSLYICGTDEYGTATETKALQEGLTPREICDKYYAMHKDIYEWFGIGFDHFGRTSADVQTEITQDIFLKLHKNGFTDVGTVEQLHCEKCNRFLADRFVHGKCPHCEYEDARGDQCDACTRLINAAELIEPRCVICGATPVVKQSTHIFLCLDKLADMVEEHFNRVVGEPDSHWSANAVAIGGSWLKRGLERRCISRDLKWGVPIPLPEFENKVFYVWFDAPIGYLSITKDLLGDAWERWWKNPKNVQYYNFLGKDNVAFHAVMFPASLLGSRDNYTVVNHMSATEYLNYENTKFSKSRGTGVFGDMARDTEIEPDVWRFYLLYMRPETQDTSFSWDDFAMKVNSELLNNLGNFINRALCFVASTCEGVIPEMKLTAEDCEFLASVARDLEEFSALLTSVKLRDGLIKILAVSRSGNQYVQAMQPWALMKEKGEQRERGSTVAGVAANVACLLAVMVYPYMPSVSRRALEQCGLTGIPLLPSTPITFLPAGHRIGQPGPLFVKMEKEAVDKLKKRFEGKAEVVIANGKVAAKKREKKTKKTPAKETPKESNAKDTTRSKKEIASAIEARMAQVDKLMAEAEAKFRAKKIQFEAAKKIDLLVAQKRLKRELESTLKKFIATEIEGRVPQIPVPVGREAVEDISDLTAEAELPKTADGPSAETKKETPMSESAQAASAKSTGDAAVPKNVKGGGDKAAKKKEKEKKIAGKSKSDYAVGDGESENAIDIGRLDLRIGRILKAEKHPNADSLYVEQVDLGETAPRTVVSGLVKFVPVEEMQNRLVMCLCNLKPVKMRGVLSEAMVMCASTTEKVEILDVPAESAPGQLVLCPEFVHRPDAVLNPKKQIWETVAVDLRVDTEGRAAYKGRPLLVNGKSPVTAASLRGVQVK